jgi:hypothetical protein
LAACVSTAPLTAPDSSWAGLMAALEAPDATVPAMTWLSCELLGCIRRRPGPAAGTGAQAVLCTTMVKPSAAPTCMRERRQSIARDPQQCREARHPANERVPNWK